MQTQPSYEELLRENSFIRQQNENLIQRIKDIRSNDQLLERAQQDELQYYKDQIERQNEEIVNLNRQLEFAKQNGSMHWIKESTKLKNELDEMRIKKGKVEEDMSRVEGENDQLKKVLEELKGEMYTLRKGTHSYHNSISYPSRDQQYQSTNIGGEEEYESNNHIMRYQENSTPARLKLQPSPISQQYQTPISYHQRSKEQSNQPSFDVSSTSKRNGVFDPESDYKSYLRTSHHKTKSDCLTSNKESDSDKQAYHLKLLKSIERRALKDQWRTSYSTHQDLMKSNENSSNRREAEILRQRKGYIGSPDKSPVKRQANNLIEEYMDFTVKLGIVQPHDSNLNQSPSADAKRRLKEQRRKTGGSTITGSYKDIDQFQTLNSINGNYQTLDRSFGTPQQYK